MDYKNKKDGIIIKFSLSVLISFIVFVLLLTIISRGRIIAGVIVADMPIGFKKYNEAESILKKKQEEFYSKKIILKHKDLIFEVLPEDVGVRFNVKHTLDKAFGIGRGGMFVGVGQKMRGLIRQYNVLVEIDWDEKKFNDFYKSNLAKLDNPAKDSIIIFKKGLNDFEVTSPKEGSVIDKEKLVNDILNRALFLSANAINIEMIKDDPEVTESDSEIARQIIKEIGGIVPFILYIEGKEWRVSDEEIADLLYFPAEYPKDIKKYYQNGNFDSYNADNKIMGVGLDEKKTKDFFTVLATRVNREPVNAELRFQNSQVTLFALSQDGIRLNIDKSAGIFEENVKQTQKKILLDYEKIEPEITTDSIDNLGITSLIGTGYSNFLNSPDAREHNIKVGAQKFHGVLLKPGEEFSFNKILGDVGPQTGYLPELVIKDNKTIPEYGGGLCQVSTTVFRAAINSGMKITERFAHAFPVVYYSPQGFDATIYPPHPDLRFINDTPGYLLIQSKMEGKNLIFEFYGADDGRKVRVIGPEQYDIKPDGSMKARLFQEVYDSNGELVRMDTFYSNYKSPSLYPVDRNPLE
jgi:vancomycin resistance protein YoaR